MQENANYTPQSSEPMTNYIKGVQFENLISAGSVFEIVQMATSLL